MGIDFGCALTTCEGHDTPEAAYQHWARTMGVPIRPRPVPDPRDDYTAAAEDERAEAERGFADWLAR